MRTVFAIALWAAASAGVAASDRGESTEAEAASRARLEELFIWKAADELKLPLEQERRFSDAVRGANAKRRAAADRLDKSAKELGKAGAPADAALAEYRAALVEYARAPESEFDQLRKILGPAKLAQYLALKSGMSDRLKDLLSRPQGHAKDQSTTKP